MGTKINLYANFSDWLSFTNKQSNFELRLAWNPKFLIEEIYFSKLEKMGEDWLLSDMDKEIIFKEALETYEEILWYLTLKHYRKFQYYKKSNRRPAPFILYKKQWQQKI